MVRIMGVSFVLFAHDADMTLWVLIAVARVIVAVMVVWLRRADRTLVAAALGLVIGGAVGNVVDRLRFGAVADFLAFHLMGYHWPAFHAADAGITVGVALLVLDSLFGRRGAEQDRQNVVEGKRVS